MVTKEKKLTAFEIEKRIGRMKKKGRVTRQRRIEKRKSAILKEKKLTRKIEERERLELEKIFAKQELKTKRVEEKSLKEEQLRIRERLTEKGAAGIKRKQVRARRAKGVASIFKGRKVGEKTLSRRASRIKNLAKAFGALPGKASGSGAGRPKGSYKYRIGGKPVSVFEWRKFQAQRKQQLSQFQSQQDQRLAKKGFNPEQLQDLRKQQVVQRAQQGKPVMKNNVADEELAFRDHLARNTVSPRTQQILIALRRTQNKAKSDNIEQQRRHHERNIVGRAMNLMEAHKNLVDVRLNFAGVDDQENVLMAENVFKEDPQDNILRPNRFNLMQTKEAGNNLKFF